MKTQEKRKIREFDQSEPKIHGSRNRIPGVQCKMVGNMLIKSPAPILLLTTNVLSTLSIDTVK